MYNLDLIRKQFPMLNGKMMQNKPLVFLDNASTTFKPQCVIDAINDYYLNKNSNSHRGDYDLCYAMDMEVSKARKEIASFINCSPNEVVFTSGDTMSLNTIAFGYAMKFLKPGDEIIVSESEHASNLLPWYKAAEKTGAIIKFVDLDNSGKITIENLKKILNHKTKIVAFAHVGNVLAYEIDIKPICALVHSYGAIFVVDGAQSVPHVKTDFKGWDIDFLTFSAHKMCGPTGIGCLIGKYDLLEKMDSFLTGGGMNVTFTKSCNVEPYLPPVKFEAGTLDLAGIMGFKAAVKFINEIGVENIHKHDVELVDYAISRLKNNPNIIIYNKDAHSSVLTFNVKGVFAQDEATLLNSKGIAVRSGQHCAKVLVDFLKTPATVRMSTYLYTTKEEIDIFVDALVNGGDILDAYFND